MTITSMNAELADELHELLAQIPLRLTPRIEQFPLLAALRRAAGAGVVRRLVCVASQVHLDADERRTAEYLLRNRHRATSTPDGAATLISAARFAAEMDVRSARCRATPIGAAPLEDVCVGTDASRTADPSVGEVVLVYLKRVTGHRPATDLARNRFLDAVVLAVGLSEQHRLRNGSRPSLIALRGNARPSSRLVVHLRAEFDDDIAARSLAHLLLGGTGAAITSSLLWWAAQPHLDPRTIPLSVRNKWIADLADADPAVRARFRRGNRRMIGRIPVSTAS